MTDVFLSYDREDGIKAGTIAQALEAAGHSVWWDRHIKGGSQFSKEIEGALGRAEAVVVLWSRNSIESAWVRDETATGRDTGRLVPVRIDTSSPPLGFRQYQTIDLGDGRIHRRSTAIGELIDAVAALAQRPGQEAGPSSPPPARTSPRQGPLTRRTVVAALLAAGAAGAGGFFLLRDRQAASPEVAALLAQAWQAWTQGTSEGNNQAIGLYKRAIELDPAYADAWGFLGCAYADRSHYWSAPVERATTRERAKEAGRRALELDSRNAYGRAALAYAQPIIGHWLEMEREFRHAIGDQPEKWLITYSLALHLPRVGRLAEAAKLFGELLANAPTANQFYFHVEALWGSGQLEEADRVRDDAAKIYATHPAIWATRFYMLLHGGRAGAALALVQDTQARPSGIEQYLRLPLAVAQAMVSRKPADVDSAMDMLTQESRASAFLAERAIQFASALGRLDEAFGIADALYFSRGFAVPDREPADGQPVDVTLDSRETRLLFLPSVRAMRADSRFDRLVDEIGLERYWREVGVQPDYRQA